MGWVRGEGKRFGPRRKRAGFGVLGSGLENWAWAEARVGLGN